MLQYAQQKNLELELSARNELLNNSSLICITDKQGIIIYVNDLYCQTYLYKRNELIGKKYFIFRHPELDSELIDSISYSLNEGSTWNGELIDVKKNGETTYSRATVTPVKNEFGETQKFIWSRIDITHYKTQTRTDVHYENYLDKNTLENVKYAQRIQQAILPDELILKNMFSQSFVLYKPQNNVSGDFYWFKKLHNENNMIVLGDSTGHGVSASYISMLSISKIYNLIDEKKILSPSKILSRLESFLNKILSKGSGAKIIESVECAIFNYNPSTRQLAYKTNGIKCILIREGRLVELQRIRASQSSINFSDDDNEHLQLKAKDRLYMFSDGYFDQFGGVRNKKYTWRRVKNFLLESANISMNEQKELLLKQFEEWKGNYEQTDDVTVLGFEIE